MRKSERIDAAHDSWPTGSNPATVFTVPRPRAKFAVKGKSQNLGIVLADIGNFTTTASRVLGLGELEPWLFMLNTPSLPQTDHAITPAPH